MIRSGNADGGARGVPVLARRLAAAALVLATAGVTGCTTDDAPPEASAGTTTAAPTSSAPPQAPSIPTPPPDEAEIPVARDAGHADAVATFGEVGVRGALADDARIARIALADCLRWRSGTVDPQLSALVSPALMVRVQEELARPPGTPPSLLSHLPEDDGNGNDEAAAVRRGCQASAPLDIGPGPEPSLRVDRTDLEPHLVLAASFDQHVAFGDLVVGAGQDWVLTSTPTAAGWQLTDATTDAQVNWHPDHG